MEAASISCAPGSGRPKPCAAAPAGSANGLSAFSLERRLLLRRELERGAVVNRGLAARHLPLAPPLQLVRRLVAGVKATGGLELFRRLLVEGEALRLAEFLVPGKPEPIEIVADAGDVFFLRALQVGVVEAQENVPPSRRANSQLNTAGRILPICSRPVGLGAKRTFTFWSWIFIFCCALDASL